MMKYMHPVYGEIVIDDLIILELINTKIFQRLKKISQSGLPKTISHSEQGTRYNHSIGVYYLLNKFNASKTEQVAGLLHDISHTAFSHVIDIVFGTSTSVSLNTIESYGKSIIAMQLKNI